MIIMIDLKIILYLSYSYSLRVQIIWEIQIYGKPLQCFIFLRIFYIIMQRAIKTNHQRKKQYILIWVSQS